MNLRSRNKAYGEDEPEISFVPLIDVLLVVLIFFMASSTFAKFSDLQINLPSAEANKSELKPQEVHVAVTSDGRYAIDKQIQAFTDVSAFANTLQLATGGRADSLIIIHADAAATHQSVVNVMEAARLAKLQRIAFATQKIGG
jgi:biopolymer transport protein ExbD